MKWIFFLVIFFSLESKASLYFQHSFSMGSEDADLQSLEYSAMRNISFIGAGFGGGKRFIIGQSIIQWNRTAKTSEMANESDISLLELGPRVQFFLNQSKNFYISYVYNFYAKGTRNVDGEEQEIEGTSSLASIGIQLKWTKKIFLGISYNIHQVSVAETIVNNTQAEVSESYSYNYPAIELSIRFK